MTSLKPRNDVESKVQWEDLKNEQPLKIFDFHRNKSRIPILVHKSRHSGTRRLIEERPAEPVQFATHLLSFKENSKIPIYNPHSKQFEKQITDNSNKIETFHEEEIEPSIIKKRMRLPFGREDRPNVKTKKAIKLRGLELTSLPEDLFERKELESLTLSPERESCLDFKLPFLPSAIGKLINLRILILDTNELQTIPEEIKSLHLLETLILSNNLLSDLPEGLGHLDNLKSLHLANNTFVEMPQMICNLKSLEFLDMSDNNITSIPSEIEELAGSIHTLLLLMNDITSLPDEFPSLTSLTSLWLGENGLRTLPEKFGDLFKLDWGLRPCSSNIEGNPLVHPPIEICQQGPRAIQKYFHNVNESKKKKMSTGKKINKDIKVSEVSKQQQKRIRHTRRSLR